HQGVTTREPNNLDRVSEQALDEGRADEAAGADDACGRTTAHRGHRRPHRGLTMARRLRLMVVASTFPGHEDDGTPAFVRDLSSRLSEAFETTVLVPRVPGSQRSEVIGNLRVERFPYFPRRWEDLAHGAILENLRERPLRWLQVPPFRSEEHTSELQSRENLVCRLLLEKNTKREATTLAAPGGEERGGEATAGTAAMLPPAHRRGAAGDPFGARPRGWDGSAGGATTGGP